jgi:hypothetical protein
MFNEPLGPVRDSEVFDAISRGEIIKEYPEDKPYPSVLILGTTEAGRLALPQFLGGHPGGWAKKILTGRGELLFYMI